MTLVSRKFYNVSLPYRFCELSWNCCPRSGFRLLTLPPPELPFTEFTKDLHIFPCFKKTLKQSWSHKQLCPCKPGSEVHKYITTDEFSKVIDNSVCLHGIHVHTYNCAAYRFLLSQLRARKPIKSLTINLSKEFFEIANSQTVLKQVRNLCELSIAFRWERASDSHVSSFNTVWELVALNSPTLRSLDLGFVESMEGYDIAHDWQSPISSGQWPTRSQPLQLNELRIFQYAGLAADFKVTHFFTPETLTTSSLVDSQGFDDVFLELAKENRLPNLKALELCRSTSKISNMCRIVEHLPPLEVLSLTSFRHGYHEDSGDWFAFGYLDGHKENLRVLWLDVWPRAFKDLSSDVDKPSTWRKIYKPDLDNPFDFSDYPNLRELALPETFDELEEVIPAPQLQKLRSLQERSSTRSQTLNYKEPFKKTSASLFKIIGDRQIALKARQAYQSQSESVPPAGSAIASNNPILPSLSVLIDGEMFIGAYGNIDVPKICRAEYLPLKQKGKGTEAPTEFKTILKLVPARKFWRYWPDCCLFGHARGPWAWIGRPFPNGRHTGMDWVV
ncbi:hypothetical protein TWF506_003262 [Arthrobotrys conoides]|uniref:Uncharacterized protein n=1 Tax=Arthrobotrys conoides TaxID=74498 RepID=A0AAN8NED3_9PEZI